MQRQPRLSLAEYNDLVTWRPPCSLYSTWPAHRPLTDRSPWWRHFTETRAPARSMSLPPAAFERHVDEIAAFMRTLENPWQGEGPGRHCVRVRLLMSGAWSWADADFMAQEVVGEALRRCGCTERPSWQEGQPDFAQLGYDPVRYTRCLRCGEIIPENAPNSGWQSRYCSQRCRAADRYLHRRTQAQYWDALAARGEMKRRERERQCIQCGASFIQRHATEPSEHCSKSCAAKTREAKRGAGRGEERQCLVCCGIFRVSVPSRPQVTCSRRCGTILQHRGRHAKPKPEGDEQAPPRKRAAG